jgi:putative ABC transport system permease protein
MYPDADAVGQRLGADSGIRIVGVVADIRARSLLERPLPAVYLPRTQEASEFFCLLVRTPVAPQQLSADLRAIVEDLYPEQPVERVARLVEIIDDTVADRRAYAVIAGAFAVSMLLLSVLGLCGHLSHAVSERLRDLAIRSALGASPRQQVQLLMRHVGLALIGGVTTATLVVYLSFPLLAPVVFGIGRLDVVSWALSALVVTACTAISMSVPSRSLSRLQLATLLRRN